MRKIGIGLAFWAALFGAAVMAVMIYSLKSDLRPMDLVRGEQGAATGTVSHEDQGEIALSYAAAIREGHCDRAIAMILWMSERLQRTQVESPGRVPEERESLCRFLTDRPIEGNRLTDEGIEDQYVFAPGATFELLEVDEGRDDLDGRVYERAWIRVRYPRKERAPLSLDGNPIQSLIVGVNTSADAHILKASVIGNLEILSSRIDDDWSDSQEAK